MNTLPLNAPHILQKALLAYLCCPIALYLSAHTAHAQASGTADGPAAKNCTALIVSPTIPTDSLGETVYACKGPQTQDAPVVAGTFTPPQIAKFVKAKYPKSMRKARSTTEVVVKGVVSQAGKFIDSSAESQTEPEAATNARSSVQAYVFRPATLNGKPIAFQTNIQVAFRIY